MWDGHMDGWWAWGMLMMAAWVVLIGAGIWWVARSLPSGRSGHARDILDERYARGEITSEEYRERVEQLQ
jgi:putative membrane protein